MYTEKLKYATNNSHKRYGIFIIPAIFLQEENSLIKSMVDRINNIIHTNAARYALKLKNIIDQKKLSTRFKI